MFFATGFRNENVYVLPDLGLVNFGFKMMIFGFKMMNFGFKMMNFVVKMMN